LIAQADFGPEKEEKMRTSLVAVALVAAAVLTAGPALGGERTLSVDTKRIDFGTIAAPGDVYSDAISITNTSDQPVALDLSITLSKPRDWSQSFSPFIVEDLGIPPSWDPCDELAPGATCVVYLTFQTDQAGTFAGWLWINDTYRVKLRAVAT
jgi:hypothetical protein